MGLVCSAPSIHTLFVYFSQGYIIYQVQSQLQRNLLAEQLRSEWLPCRLGLLASCSQTYRWSGSVEARQEDAEATGTACAWTTRPSAFPFQLHAVGQRAHCKTWRYGHTCLGLGSHRHPREGPRGMVEPNLGYGPDQKKSWLWSNLGSDKIR